MSMKAVGNVAKEKVKAKQTMPTVGPNESVPVTQLSQERAAAYQPVNEERPGCVFLGWWPTSMYNTRPTCRGDLREHTHVSIIFFLCLMNVNRLTVIGCLSSVIIYHSSIHITILYGIVINVRISNTLKNMFDWECFRGVNQNPKYISINLFSYV